MVSFGQVTKPKFRLIETGEYVFTLNDLGEISGDYGDRMTWDFLVAPKDDPTNYISTRDDGKPQIVKMFTDTEITLNSRQHKWIQALAGKTFADGANLPDGDDLVGKRMLAYLTHYTPKKGKNQGVPKEDIVDGSAKPFSLPGSKKSDPAPKPAAPPASTDDERAALIAEMRKQIRRAAILDIESAAAWGDVNLDEMTALELKDGLDFIKDTIESAQQAA